MMHFAKLCLFVLFAGAAAACADPLRPDAAPVAAEVAFSAFDNACWGQATKVFARTGTMGEHASGEPTPRLGLARLARALHEAGVISEPTMQALGAFVASELGLSIDACT